MCGIRFIWLAVCLMVGVWCATPTPVHAQVRSLKAVTYAGKRYVAVKDLAVMYGLPMSLPGGNVMVIRGQNVSLQFKGNERQAVINGVKVWLHTPVTKLRGQWHVSDADAQFVVDPLVRPSAYLGARGTRTVVLDAGHGGKDPGAVGAKGSREKDVALDIARRVKAHLAAAGVRVVMTRDTDRFWELEDRPYLARKGNGDVLVSIHLNATASRSVQGVETFVVAAAGYPSTAGTTLGAFPAVPNNKFNHSSTALGNQIQKALTGVTRAEDRGLKRARFVVLREATMPSALVECGFLTNPQEEAKLVTPSYRETVALGIAQGILNYFALVNRAKLELGAPLLQKPILPGTAAAMAARTGGVAPAPAVAAPSAPTPMAARSWGVPSAPPRSAPVPGAARPVAPAPAPVAAPVAAPVVAPAPRPAVAPPPAPPVVAPAPAPVRPPMAVAPPPSMLLNPNLTSTP